MFQLSGFYPKSSTPNPQLQTLQASQKSCDINRSRLPPIVYIIYVFIHWQIQLYVVYTVICFFTTTYDYILVYCIVYGCI